MLRYVSRLRLTIGCSVGSSALNRDYALKVIQRKSASTDADRAGSSPKSNATVERSMRATSLSRSTPAASTSQFQSRIANENDRKDVSTAISANQTETELSNEDIGSAHEDELYLSSDTGDADWMNGNNDEFVDEFSEGYSEAAIDSVGIAEIDAKTVRRKKMIAATVENANKDATGTKSKPKKSSAPAATKMPVDMGPPRPHTLIIDGQPVRVNGPSVFSTAF
jgi:hypothetical protein